MAFLLQYLCRVIIYKQSKNYAALKSCDIRGIAKKEKTMKNILGLFWIGNKRVMFMAFIIPIG
jgi:hypothetical protein